MTDAEKAAMEELVRRLNVSLANLLDAQVQADAVGANATFKTLEGCIKKVRQEIHAAGGEVNVAFR